MEWPGNWTDSEPGNWSDGDGNSSMGACPHSSVPGVVWAAQLLYGAVCAVGLLGNSLVIYVVLRFANMRTVTNMYIVNLAVADECFLIGIPFLIGTMSVRAWPFGRLMCQAYMVSTGINQFTSSIFLVIMSADRYIAVCHPIAAPRLRTPLVSRAVSAAAWTASALLMTPIFLYTTLIPHESGPSCNIVWPERGAGSGSGQTGFILYSFALGFAAPLALIFVFYCLVLRRLRTVGPKGRSKEKRRSHRKVTRLVLAVVAVYAACWLPYWACQVALLYAAPAECAGRLTVSVFLLAACFSYSNSAVNPLLYAFLSDNFKKSFLKACTCARRAAPANAPAPLLTELSGPRRAPSRRGPPAPAPSVQHPALLSEPSTGLTSQL